MILHIPSKEYRDKPGYPYQLVFWDYHGTAIPKDPGAPGHNVEKIFNPYLLEDILPEASKAGKSIGAFYSALITELNKHPHQPDSHFYGWPDDPTDIWHLMGSLPQLTKMWEEMMHEVDYTPSGDDDVFDYWPGGVESCFQIAIDLDFLTGKRSRKFRKKVRDLYNGYANNLELDDSEKLNLEIP